MNVDQLDELIRKYLSTGVAMVLVLVGPAAAPSGATAVRRRPRPARTPPARRPPTAAPRAAPTPTSGIRRAGPTTPGPSPTAEPDADPQAHRRPPRRSPPPNPTPTPTTTAGPAATPPPPPPPRLGHPQPRGRLHRGPVRLGCLRRPRPRRQGHPLPAAARVADGVLTIDGDAEGTTAGMAWGAGQKYGRWEGRVRAPAGDPTYNALLLLWPDAEDFPVGGEIDFMEMTDHTRQATNVFLHHGKDNAQEHGMVKIDATQWHNWAVEWTPKGITTYVDGKQWWHTDNGGRPPARPHAPVHPARLVPAGARGAVRPSQMQVDWVRQYPLDAPPSDKSVMRDLIQRTFGW